MGNNRCGIPYPCKHCSCDATFDSDCLDPVYKKGIWMKHKLENICIKRMSIAEQNNRGKYQICDIGRMSKCHFYEAEK